MYPHILEVLGKQYINKYVTNIVPIKLTETRILNAQS